MRPGPPRLKRMLIDRTWERLTPSLIFAVCYAPVSIVIVLFAPFHLGDEFATGFCFGSAGMFGCVIIGDLHRGYREFKRQSDEIERLDRQINEPQSKLGTDRSAWRWGNRSVERSIRA